MKFFLGSAFTKMNMTFFSLFCLKQPEDYKYQVSIVHEVT